MGLTCELSGVIERALILRVFSDVRYAYWKCKCPSDGVVEAGAPPVPRRRTPSPRRADTLALHDAVEPAVPLRPLAPKPPAVPQRLLVPKPPAVPVPNWL